MAPVKQQRRFRHPRSIVIVRHGETLSNTAGRKGRLWLNEKERAKLCGLADHELPLTKAGQEQARSIGRLIRREWGFDRFNIYYDSGYRRSIETLELLLEAFPESERDPARRRSHLDLRERDAGYLYSMTVSSARKAFPWWVRYERLVGPVYSRPPGGESLADAWQRVHSFLNSVRRSRAGQDLLVVTHGRLMLGFKYWLEKSPARDVARLYDEHAHIANGEAWWYRREPGDTAYHRVALLRPGD